MSESAKNRCDPEKMREISLNMWKDPEMVKHHSEIRKGKRLSKPKISDEMVEEIREKFRDEYEELLSEVELINIDRHNKNKSWKKTSPEMWFSNKYKNLYNVSATTIKNIITNKARTKIYPCICKS